MLGLLGIGVAMIVGAGLRIAAVGGGFLMLFMWLATFPVAGAATNPILTSHWHEALLLIIAALTLSGDTWGLGKWWANREFVQKNRSEERRVGKAGTSRRCRTRAWR